MTHPLMTVIAVVTVLALGALLGGLGCLIAFVHEARTREGAAQQAYYTAEALGIAENPWWTARVRSREVLEAALQPKQVRQLHALGYISVTGKSGRQYRVPPTGTPVVEYVGDIPVNTFCLVSTERLPAYDLVVQNVLLLETDEARFRREAHIAAW